jgi:hypothetical protein
MVDKNGIIWEQGKPVGVWGVGLLTTIKYNKKNDQLP